MDVSPTYPDPRRAERRSPDYLFTTRNGDYIEQHRFFNREDADAARAALLQQHGATNDFVDDAAQERALSEIMVGHADARITTSTDGSVEVIADETFRYVIAADGEVITRPLALA